MCEHRSPGAGHEASIQGVLGLWMLLAGAVQGITLSAAGAAPLCLRRGCWSNSGAKFIIPRASSCPWATPLLSGEWGPGMSCCPCQSCLSPAGTSEKEGAQEWVMDQMELPGEGDLVTDRCQSHPSLQQEGPSLPDESRFCSSCCSTLSIIFGFPSP